MTDLEDDDEGGLADGAPTAEDERRVRRQIIAQWFSDVTEAIRRHQGGSGQRRVRRLRPGRKAWG
jgi:hypothetical protein